MSIERKHKWRGATEEESRWFGDPHSTRTVCSVCGLNVCMFCPPETEPDYRECGFREVTTPHVGGVCGTCGEQLFHSETRLVPLAVDPAEA